MSADAVKAVSKFDHKYDPGFRLLADQDHAVSEQYGTWVEKPMYGRKNVGVRRSTFVIDGEGKVAHVIPKASPKTRDAEVLEILGELGATA